MLRRVSLRTLLSIVSLAAMLVITGGGAAASASQASVATGSHRAAASGPMKIIYVDPLPDTPDWGRSGKYLLEAQKKYGYSATVVGPSTLDIPTMITEIQDAIAQHPKVIITCACAAGAFNHVFHVARQHGIVVVTIATDAPGSNLFLGTSYVAFGRNAAEDLIAKMHGHANIGIVSTNGTTENQVQEIAAFKATIKSHPGMKIVDSVYDNSDVSTAASQMSEMLAANPSINAIWTVEGAAPGAVPTVLKQAGKKPGQVTVLAIDLQAPTRAGIAHGWIWATEYQRFFDALPLAAKCAIEIAHGAHVAHSVNTGALLITKANLPKTMPPPHEGLPTSC